MSEDAVTPLLTSQQLRFLDHAFLVFAKQPQLWLPSRSAQSEAAAAAAAAMAPQPATADNMRALDRRCSDSYKTQTFTDEQRACLPACMTSGASMWMLDEHLARPSDRRWHVFVQVTNTSVQYIYKRNNYQQLYAMDSPLLSMGSVFGAIVFAEFLSKLDNSSSITMRLALLSYLVEKHIEMGWAFESLEDECNDCRQKILNRQTLLEEAH